jgi:LuxR family maltose regulon positive regulatory protein
LGNSANAVVTDGYLHSATLSVIRLGSLRWQNWLANNTKFVYVGEHGRFTAQRELRRGCAFWYAYRRRQKKLGKVYLGKAEHLTEAVLAHADARLAGQSSTMLTMISSSDKLDRAHISHRYDGSVGRMPYLSLAKLRPPALPNKLIERKRLIKRMNAPITIIHAPSGSGKSTLLNAWRQMCPKKIAVAWVSLDAEDNSPQKFWSMVSAAMCLAHPLLDARLPSECRASTKLSIHEFVCDLLNGIAEICSNTIDENTPRRVSLVLDDFHQVQHADTLADLQFMLDHLPTELNILIASHTKPDLALGQLRMNGLISELDVNDLRFNLNEGTDFLKQHITDSTLTEKDIDLLISRTEGWAAGLRLATLAIASSSSFSQTEKPRQFLDSFTGAHDFFREYFIERVFQQQSQSVKSFLLKTSILKHMTGDLCDSVTGRDDGDEMLNQLWNDSIFIARMGEQGWYQYHELFDEMLCSQLPLFYGSEVEELHRRAAQWYRQHQFPAEAIQHLLHIEAWEEAASLIEEMALNELARSGEDSRLLRWLQQLPVDVVRRHKTLLYAYMNLAMVALPRSEVGRFLSSIETAINLKVQRDQTQDEREVIREIRHIRQVWATSHNAQKHLQFSRNNDDVWQSLRMVGAAAHLVKFHPLQAAPTLSELYEKAKSQQHLFLIMMAGGSWTTTLLAQHAYTHAESIAHQILGEAHKLRQSLPETASIAFIGLSEVYLARNQLSQAEHYVQKGEEVDPNPTSSNMKIRTALQRTRIFIAQRQFDLAIAAIQSARKLHEKNPSGLWSDEDLLGYEALVMLRRGDLDAAEYLLREINDQQFSIHPHTGLVQAEWLLAKTQPQEASQLLQKLIERYPNGYSFQSILPAQLMLAHAYLEMHESQLGKRCFIDTLKRAAPERYVRPFLDHAKRVAPYLTKLVEQDEIPVEAQRFVKDLTRNLEFASHSFDVFTNDAFATLISKREHEILCLVGEGLSNRDIAATFCISDHTVKAHLVNIFRKLGAKNRTQALARAQSLGLVRSNMDVTRLATSIVQTSNFY